MGGPFDSIAPFASSPELRLFPSSAGEGSQESESSGSLQVEPTGIFLMSPPESTEANDGAPSRDNFQTPQEEVVPSASSEEKGGDGPACDGKTVDLGRDTDLGFSETEMAEQTVAELESGGEIGGCKLVRVELPESEWAEFRNWKRKLAFRARMLDEPPAKQLVLEKSLDFDPREARAGTGIVEEKSRDKMVKSMKDLKSCSVIPRFEPLGGGGLQMKDQMLIKSKGCTQVVSLDSEAVMVKNGLESNDDREAVRLVSGGKGTNSEAVLVNNGLESNDDSEAVRLVSGGKGSISEAVIVKNGLRSNDDSEAVRLVSGDEGTVSEAEAVMAKNGLESNDDGEAVRLVSGGKGAIAEAVMANNGTEDAGAKTTKTGMDLKDCTEDEWLGSRAKGQDIAKNVFKSNPSKNVSKSNPLTQVVILDPEQNDQVSEDSAKLGLAWGNSTEVIVLDSDDSDEGLVIDEAISKHGLGSNDPTEVVEDEGLVYGAEKVDKAPNTVTTEILMHKGQGIGGAEKIDKAPNTGTTEMLKHKGQGMGGSKNKEDKDAPSGSNSSQRPKSVRVLPSTLLAKEGDSSKNTTMDLLSSALRKLPKQHSDPRFENLSILDIAKQRGVTFPRPRWWTEEEDDD